MITSDHIFAKKIIVGVFLMKTFINAMKDQVQFIIEMDLKTQTEIGIGLVRNDEYIGLYFNLTAWNIKKPSNVIQLSLRKGS